MQPSQEAVQTSGTFVIFHDALKLLASDADSQISKLKELRCWIDDPAMDMDYALGCFWSYLETGRSTEKVQSLTKQLDDFLQVKDEPRRDYLYGYGTDALRADPFWQTVREMAKGILREISQ